MSDLGYMQCKSKTRKKEQCKRPAMKGCTYCYIHSYRFRGVLWWKNLSIHGIVLALALALMGFWIARHYFNLGPTLRNQEELLKGQHDISRSLSKDAIVLSPENIDLGSGAEKAIVPFYVRNTGETDLYQIVIKLLLESTVLSVTNNDIRVDWTDRPHNMEMPLPVSGDPFIQGLVTHHGEVKYGMDAKGRQGLWIIIARLPPHTSAGFLIRNQSFKALPPGAHSLVASIASYTNTPMRTTLGPDGHMTSWYTTSAGEWDLHTMCGAVVFSTWGRTAPYDGADIVSNTTCLFEAGKWNEAEKELTRAIQQNPSLGVAYCNRSTLLWKRGRPREGYQDAMKALSLLPDDPLVHATLANCLRLLGRKDEALIYFTKAVELAGPEMPYMFYNRGLLLSEMNRFTEARMDFDEAIMHGYTNEWPYYDRGVTFLKEKSFSNAIISLSIAIDMCPDMVDAYVARAMAYSGLGQVEMADKDIREAIQLKPALTNTFKTMTQ